MSLPVVLSLHRSQTASLTWTSHHPGGDDPHTVLCPAAAADTHVAPSFVLTTFILRVSELSVYVDVTYCMNRGIQELK